MAILRVGLLKIIFLAIFSLCSISCLPAWAADIVVLQSAKIPAYNDAQRGLELTLSQSVPSRGRKAVLAHTVTTHILSEVKSTNSLRKEIVRHKPDLLVVIGSSSLSLVKNITDIPILYLMVPYPEFIVQAQDNITGIKMNITADKQIEALIRTMPHVKNIGLLYDPERTGALVNEAREYMQGTSLSLLAFSVKTPDEVPQKLNMLVDRVESFWMVPDRTVLTPQTVDAILLFSLENRVPVFTFSEKYLDLGAVLSVSFDPLDMGKQAGEMALQILGNTATANIPAVSVRKVLIRTNSAAAKVLGVVVYDKDLE